MSDVYDLAAENWCPLCQMAHLPCETDADGVAMAIPDYCVDHESVAEVLACD